LRVENFLGPVAELVRFLALLLAEPIELAGASIEIRFPGTQAPFHLTNLCHGRFESHLSLFELALLSPEIVRLRLETGPHVFGVLNPGGQLGFARFQARILIEGILMFGPHFLAHAFEARAERGQHGLLTFESSGTLCQVGLDSALFFFLLTDLDFFTTQIVVKRSQLLCLLF